MFYIWHLDATAYAGMEISIKKNGILSFLKSLKRAQRAVTTGIYVLPIKQCLCGSAAD